MTVMPISSRCLIVAGMLLLAGCGGDEGGDLPATVDASGVVLLDGKAVQGASVVFIPVDPGQYPAFSSTDRNGNFDLKAFEAKGGAVPGKYQVQVSKTVEITEDGTPKLVDLGPDAAHAEQDPNPKASWENMLPPKYASAATSQITVDIPETGRSDIKIELVSKP